MTARKTNSFAWSSGPIALPPKGVTRTVTVMSPDEVRRAHAVLLDDTRWPSGPGTGKTGNPTIFEYSSKTHQRVLLVKRLRKRMTRSLPEIANDLGYSPSQILAYERGYDRHGKALPEKKWKRYIWALRGLCQEYGTLIDGEETRRQDAQGDARVQTRQSAPGHRQTRKKGRQGHKPKAGDRHRFERGPQSGRGGRPKDPLNVKFNVFEES